MKLFLKIAITILIAFAFYQSRWIFSFKFEPEYYENFYYESQYAYPQSARGISDGTVYKYVGYKLTQGENPFNINWEIPPFGKAMYGYSSRLFGNPYWFSVIAFLVTLAVLFVLLAKNLKAGTAPFLGILMLILIPHFTTQSADTMLDLPLTLAYLVNIFFLFEYLDKKQIKFLIFAGVSLGIAAAIKPPVYVPFVVLVELIVIYLADKKWKNVILFPASVVAGYVAGYFVYFINHPNPIPWLKLHKKIYDFYLLPSVTLKPLAAIKEVFNVGTWGPIYAVGFVAYLAAGYDYLKNKRNLKLLTLLLFATTFLIVSSFIPFFPRYLLPLSFVFIYFILHITKGNLKLILLLCLFALPYFYKSYALPAPDGDAQAASRFMETRAYRELYRSINPDKLNGFPEKDFIAALEGFNSEIHTRKVVVTLGEGKMIGGKYYYDFDVKYFTKFGVVSSSVPLEYENVNGQWKLNWTWDNVHKGYVPGSNIKFATTPEKLVKVYEVYIIPRLMYDWNKNLDNLARLTGLAGVAINANLTRVVPNDFERFVGYLHNSITDSERDQLIKDMGAVRVKEVLLNPNTEMDANSLIFN